MKPTDINFKNIPVQAGIISNIINLDIDSHTCFRNLDELISSDQGVASLVLRVANSAFYNRGNKVGSIPLAIGLMGLGVVRSLALLAFSRSLFMQTRDVHFRLHVWQHSLLVALASQELCKKLGNLRQSDEAFIAGLMHDIGKVLMFTHNTALYAQVFADVLETGCASLRAERERFGFDHTQVGAEAVREWRLPPRFNDYMGSELVASRTDDAILSSLIAANLLLKTAGVGARKEADTATCKSALLALGLDNDLSEELLQTNFIQSLMQHETYKLCASI
jgi:putative nucleotidyltransferase with HDIG domain